MEKEGGREGLHVCVCVGGGGLHVCVHVCVCVCVCACVRACVRVCVAARCYAGVPSACRVAGD